MYLEDSAGKTAFQKAVTDVSAGALAYDTEPLTTLGRLDPFSPQFQSMTLEKGAMVFHMLRWEMGDETFLEVSARVAVAIYGQVCPQLRRGDGRGGAESQLQLDAVLCAVAGWDRRAGVSDKFTVFRLGNNKGFRTVGSIDAGSGPVPDAGRAADRDGRKDGDTARRRVAGTESQYTVETFGRPRRITIDPQNWLLKSTPDLAVRVAVLARAAAGGAGRSDGRR